MKIRNGFVSNSSSSSFLIDLDEIKFNELKIGSYVNAGYAHVNDGDDFFKIQDEKMLKAVQVYLYDKEFYNNGKNSMYINGSNQPCKSVDDIIKRYKDVKKERKYKINKINI